jgi:hypothetical protein
MIQSAMMFALGFFVSGLLWLAFSVALVRRTRRMAERRIFAKVATRRAEFEAERDELRARHAVQMHRLEREVSRVLDLATSHRLEADIKERDIGSMKAELTARLEDLNELEETLAAHRDLVQDLERRNAEARTALRATQHALQVETRRRLTAEAAMVGVRLEPTAEIPEAAFDAAVAAFGYERDGSGSVPRAPQVEGGAGEPAETYRASVVPLRGRNSAPDSVAPVTAAEPSRDVRRLAGEAHGDFERNVWRAPAVGDVHASASAGPDGLGAPGAAQERAADERVFDAVKDVRELKRTATQAGE